MKSTAFILMIITLVSKVTGLIREQFFAYYLGTGMLSDIYGTATYVPFTVFGFITAGVVASFIPIYNKVRSEKGQRQAERFTSNLVNILFIVATIFILVMMVFTTPIVKLFALGYTEGKLALTVQFTRFILLTLYATAISSVFIGYLNIHEDFITPSLTGIFMNVFLIISVIIAFKLNNFFVLAYGFVLTEFLKYMFFPKAIRKTKYKHRFFIDFNDPYIRQLLKMSLPIIASVAAVDISTMIDQSLASKLFENTHGAVAALRFASLVLQLISGVIVVSVTTSIYPSLSRYGNDGEYPKLKKTMMDAIVSSLIFVIPAMFGIMILSVPTVRLLFQRGMFDAESTALTAGVLFFYAPSLIGLTIKDITTRAFFAMGNSKTPVKITLIQVSLDIVLNLTLSYFFGIKGLALATSIASIVAGIITLISFRKQYGRIGEELFIKSLIKLLLISSLMGLGTFFIFKLLSGINFFIAFVVTVVLSMVIYGILLLMVNIPQVNLALRNLKRKKRNKKKLR